MKQLFLVTLILQLAGCAVYPQSNNLFGFLRLADYYQLERQRNITIAADSGVYIPKLKTGNLRDGEAYKQYLNLLSDTERSFKARFRKVHLGEFTENAVAALQTARQLQCDYLVIVLPINWQEGKDLPLLEENKGKMGIDRIRLGVRVLEVSSGRQIDQIKIEARSGYLTFWGDSPGNLAIVPINQLAAHLSASLRSMPDGPYK